MDWLHQRFIAFECALATTYRVVSVKQNKGEAGNVWKRGILASKPEHIGFVHDMFKPDYSMYVSGYTFAWNKFLQDNGHPPPLFKHKEYNDWWRNGIEGKKLDGYINKKDLVFELDKTGYNLLPVGKRAGRIVKYLLDVGMHDIHIIFSGHNGYHIVAPDCERYFKDFGVNMLGRTSKSLAYGAFELAGSIMDDLFGKEKHVDMRNKGREYDDADIHFAPMFPQGVRKAGYSLTEYGTVAFPVTMKELETVTNMNWYRPENLLAHYNIKGRGLPAITI